VRQRGARGLRQIWLDREVTVLNVDCRLLRKSVCPTAAADSPMKWNGRCCVTETHLLIRSWQVDDDDTATSKCLWGRSLLWTNPRPGSLTMTQCCCCYHPSAPALEGAHNCGTPQMQELLVNRASGCYLYGCLIIASFGCCSDISMICNCQRLSEMVPAPHGPFV
jgi:hypothetical protein